MIHFKHGKYVHTDLNNKKALQRMTITELWKFAMMKPAGIKQVLIDHIASKNWS